MHSEALRFFNPQPTKDFSDEVVEYKGADRMAAAAAAAL